MAKQVLIVYPKSRQRAARRWEVLIGNAEGHKAALNTAKEFEQRQSEVPSSQPVVFVGKSKAAEQIRDICPVVFNENGATCRLSKRRAVVMCEWPAGMKERDARGSARKVAEQIEALTGDTSGHALADGMPKPASVERAVEAKRHGRGWLQKSWDYTKKYTGSDLAVDVAVDKNIRDRYVELLYLYAAARFVAEYLDTFAAE